MLKSGEDELTEYTFNKHVVHHLFCSICGIQPFAEAADPGPVSRPLRSMSAASTASIPRASR